jgi:spermidine synthase
MAIPWKILERTATPDGLLELRKRGPKDFQIALSGMVLMNSAANRSEEALGKLACTDLRSSGAARVLVAGLGLGFTLRAVLDALPAGAQVIVAELNPVVAEWCKGPLADLTASAATDPRVTLEIADVVNVIRRAAGDPQRRLDAIVLDLYTGPHAGSHPRNDPAYGTTAIAEMKRALSPHGRLAVWGEAANQAYEERLTRGGFKVARHRPGTGGLRHVVYLAQRVV